VGLSSMRKYLGGRGGVEGSPFRSFLSMHMYRTYIPGMRLLASIFLLLLPRGFV